MVKDLIEFSLGMMNGEDGKMLIDKYREAIDNVTPHDMLLLEERQLLMGVTPLQIKTDIEKIINVLSPALDKYQWKRPKEHTFLFYLMLENDAFTFKLNQIKKVIKSYKGKEESDFTSMKRELLPRYQEFLSFDYHYIKKENILFPYLEKLWSHYRPLKVMWSLHDDIRNSLKSIIEMLNSGDSQWSAFNQLQGKYFSLVFRMMQKENIIVFPVASDTVSDEAWDEMYIQSFEYPFPFIDPPQMPKKEENRLEETKVGEVGSFSLEEALLAFNHLPVDITIVDENDRVRFFNNPKDRFFPRSPAIIGRDVQNCHPPESVHIVEEIIEAFRTGKRDSAQFHIKLKGSFILIQYFALRGDQGEYRGVMEVSQDITKIKELDGEKRLLDWK